MSLSTNHYVILRALNQVPKDKVPPTASQIADVITELNGVWVISRQSIAGYLGYLRSFGYVNNRKIYHKDQKPFRHRIYGTLYPHTVHWYITERGRYAMDYPSAKLAAGQRRNEEET